MRRPILILLALALLAVGAVHWWPRPEPTAPIAAAQPMAKAEPTALPTPLTSAPGQALIAGPAQAPVAIQDGKTIDFSSGQPGVRSTPEDQAAMAAALKEMDEAAKDVTFPADAKK
jgi:hypothetical protein